MSETNGKKRTIDERLDALAQSVELIAAMQQTTEKAQIQTGRQIRSLGRLVRTIVLDHEARLVALESDDEELLTALKGWAAACEFHGADSQEFFDARNRAYAAIAKAEGR